MKLTTSIQSNSMKFLLVDSNHELGHLQKKRVNPWNCLYSYSGLVWFGSLYYVKNPSVGTTHMEMGMDPQDLGDHS